MAKGFRPGAASVETARRLPTPQRRISRRSGGRYNTARFAFFQRMFLRSGRQRARYSAAQS